jgi:hypothetical protein
VGFIGTWWYFPFAIAVKTPVATLAVFGAILIAATGSLIKIKHGTHSRARSPGISDGWTTLCLILPVVIYLGTAMSSNLNLGLRHILAIYPLLFAAAGLLMARLWELRKKVAIAVGGIVIAGLAIESGSAYPNYIPFFNVLAGGSRGGLRLLSDSNLDWGQDLPLLAGWQHKHPEEKLYLAYFGITDPLIYGIRYTNITEGYFAGPPQQPISSPGVIAISATTLQGQYSTRNRGAPAWRSLWKLKPFEVLGGSIYLFRVPPHPEDLLPRGESLIN